MQVVFDSKKAAEHAKSEFARLNALKANAEKGATKDDELKALFTEYESFPQSYSVKFEIGNISSADAQKIGDSIQATLNTLNEKLGGKLKALTRLFNAPNTAPKLIGCVYSPERAVAGVKDNWQKLNALNDKVKLGAKTPDETKALFAEYQSFPITFQINWAVADLKDTDAQALADDIRTQLHALNATTSAKLDTLPRLFNARAEEKKSSQSDITTLNFLFKQIDTNNSGTIDFREARVLLKLWYTPSDTEIKDLLAQFGSKDGKISKEEFVTAHSTAHDLDTGNRVKLDISPEAQKALEERFSALDTDNSGFIESKELEILARNIFTPSDDMVEKFFGIVDSDSDWTITFAEFVKKAEEAQKSLPQFFGDKEEKKE